MQPTIKRWLPVTAAATMFVAMAWHAEGHRGAWSWADELRVALLIDAYHAECDAKCFSRATSCCEELCRLDRDPEHFVNLARLYANVGRFDEAMEKLRDAVACAGNDPSMPLADQLRRHEDLAPLRHRPEFAALTLQAAKIADRPRSAAELAEGGRAARLARFAMRSPGNPYLAALRVAKTSPGQATSPDAVLSKDRRRG